LAASAGSNVVSIRGDRDEDEPVVECTPDGTWFAGRYIGSLVFEDRRLTVRPRFGLSVIRSWLSQATNVSLVDTPGKLREGDEFIVQLLGVVWARAFVEAARHGLPGLKRDVPFKGGVLRGRLDVAASARLLAAGAAQVVSVRRERSVDHAASRAIVAAYAALHRRLGRNDAFWLPERATDLLPHLIAVTGARPKVPSKAELAEVRYTPITSGFAKVAELSRRIARNRGLASDSAFEGECRGVLLDVAELWELYVLAAARRAAPDLQIKHGTVEQAAPGSLLVSEQDGVTLVH
jgi:5-methylcytosine-specific restriction enzyme subunit McrC